MKHTYSFLLAILFIVAASKSESAPGVGAWRTLEPMTSMRQEVGVGILDGKIYVVGGFNSSAQSVNTVERYDPVEDTWETVAPLIAPQPLNHVGLAAANGMLFVIGGLLQNFSSVNTVYAYAPGTNQWTAKANMPTARGGMGVAVVNGLIYAAGGLPASRSGEFAVYDPVNNQWATLANMPTPRDHLAAAAVNGKFYAIGGRFNFALQPQTEEYDPSTQQWTGRSNIPTPRGGIAAAAVNGRIYVFGGEGNPANPNGVYDQVEEFDPVGFAWRTMTPMPVPRHGIGVAVFEGEIFIPGGGPIEGFSSTNHNDAFRPPILATGRAAGDFDNSGCTNVTDFLFLLDHWQELFQGTFIGLDDFLSLVDNWLLGANC